MNLKHALAAALFAVSSMAVAADEEVEKLLGAMRDAYKAVNTAKFTTVTTMNIEEKDVSTTFEATYKAADKLYLWTDNMFGMEGKIKLICDGKTISVTTPSDKDETPFSLEELSSAMPLNLESMCFWDWKRQLSTGDDGNMKKSTFKLSKDQDWNEKKWTVLEETANEQGVFVKYWIDAKTNFIWKTDVFEIETKAKVMTCEIKKLETGLTVADSLFGG